MTVPTRFLILTNWPSLAPKPEAAWPSCGRRRTAPSPAVYPPGWRERPAAINQLNLRPITPATDASADANKLRTTLYARKLTMWGFSKGFKNFPL